MTSKGKKIATDTDPTEHQDELMYNTAEYQYTPASSAAGSSSVRQTGNQPVRKSKTIKSDGQVTLQGPLDIVGSVKSGSNVTFNGDFNVREKIEAYGSIDI
jgi:cytoskeletal protein CcmA (bactofilin family)